MSKQKSERANTNNTLVSKKEEHTISNTEKYENYKTQFQRLKKAIENKYYLEAVFIEYAIFEDRTAAILAYEGNTISKRHENDFISLHKKLNKIENLANQNKSNPPWIGRYFSNDKSDNLIKRIIDWKDENRNSLVHYLLNMNITTDELFKCAKEGADLCRELNSKANNYKRMVERHKTK